MNHLDELLEHLLGDGEIGDHAVFHRPDCFDVAGHLAEHLLGFASNRADRALAFGPPSWLIATTEGSSSTMPLPRT